MTQKRPTVLVTGGSGFIGSHLVRAIARTNRRVIATFHAHPDRIPDDLVGLDNVNWLYLDLEAADADTTATARSHLATESNSTIIHCAAMADLAAAERDCDRARTINVTATRSLAKIATRFGGRFIFFSTDQVFDGTTSFYTEHDAPSPVNEYGRTKVEAEHVVANESESGCAMALRVSLVYGTSPTGNRTASEQIMNAYAQENAVRLFTDEFRTPTYIDDIAQAILTLLDLQDDDRAWPPLLHLAGPDRVSRFEFGQLLAKVARLDPSHIEAVRQADLDLGMRRPADLSLSIERARNTIAYTPHSVESGLRRWLTK